MFESIAASIQEAIQAGNGNVDAVLQVGAGAVPSRPQCLVSRPCHMFTETGPAAATTAPGRTGLARATSAQSYVRL